MWTQRQEIELYYEGTTQFIHIHYVFIHNWKQIYQQKYDPDEWMYD